MDKKDSEVSSTNIESSESSIENEAKEDTLSKSIGELGRWQIFLIVIVTIPCQMTSAWNMLSIIFLAPKTKYRCISRRNSTEGIFNGTCYSDCEEYEYTTDFPKNIITEFELICDRAWLANLTQTLFMFGVLVGSMVFGFIADRYGRRKAILISSMLQMTLSLLLPFSPEYWTFTTIRFLLGTSTAGSLIIAYVFVIEIVGPSKRELVGSVCHIPFLMGEMIMPVIAYYLRSWKSFALGLGIPNLVFLLHIFLLPESPRWLISVGRLEEASAVMKRAAKWNNLPTKNILEAAKNIAKESNANCNQVEHKSISYMDLISNSSLRMRNLLSCVSWFILSLSFYGVTQYIGQTSTSVFITMTLVGGWQIPSMLGSGYLSKRYGRRSAIIGFLLISSVCSGLLALPDSWFYTKIAVGAIGTGCAAGAFNIMYVFTSELFPTVARNMAMGASSTVSRLGSMLAPFVAGTSQGAWVPPLVFAAAPLVAAGVCWCLPETKGRKLTDRLVDE